MTPKLCDYGCGREAKYQQTSGKWCCEKYYQRCPERNKKISESHKGKKRPPLSEEWKKKISESLKGKKRPSFSEEWKKKMSESNTFTIEQWQEKYPIFSQVEEMRYNPDKPGEKEIQVHCKNHLCPNSKEKGGWFTPGQHQFWNRRNAIEHDDGNDGTYFYCSEGCKQECSLFNLRSDLYRNTERPYTDTEYQTFRQFVLERDNYKCEYCGDKAEHVHHERPQKLEPFFALDPDLAWSFCKKCHYKYGHRDECGTGALANKIC